MPRAPRTARALSAARVPLALLSTLSLLAGSCSSAPPAPPRPAPPVSPTVSPPVPPGATLLTDPHFDPVVGAAWEALDGYWTRSAEPVAAIAYASPERFFAYRPDDPPPVTCLITAWRDNAHYCGGDHSLSVDREWLARGLPELDLDARVFTIAVLAHEWSHHIQALAGIRAGGTVQRELEADCFAGLFVSDAYRTVGPLRLGPNDAQKILDAFVASGDEGFVADGWFQPGLHGGPRERALAFATGYLTDQPSFCRSYEGSAAPVDIPLGPYLVTTLPASATRRLDLRAIEVSSGPFPALRAHLEWLPDLAAGPAVDHVLGFARQWLGREHRLVGPPWVLALDLPGTAVYQRYEQTVWDDLGRPSVFHGGLLLHARLGGGGLVMDVFTPGPAAGQSDWKTIRDYLAVMTWGIGDAP